MTTPTSLPADAVRCCARNYDGIVRCWLAEGHDGDHQWSSLPTDNEERDVDPMYVHTTLPGAFHWRDGWFFKRLNNGGVQIRYAVEINEATQFVGIVTIPPNEWVSIVSSMTEAGESENWHTIKQLHGTFP